MKLTQEQVSNLSVVELNRAMIWCYWSHVEGFVSSCLGSDIDYGDIGDDGKSFDISIPRWGYEYDVSFIGGYLSYDLVMPLVIKHKILHSIHYCASGLDNKPIYKACGLLKCKTESGYCPTLLRAYCECLVLIAMETKTPPPAR